MRAPLPNELSISVPDERTSSDLSRPPQAAQEPPVETSLVELSALLLIVLAGMVLTFAGAIVAISLG
jgi:hypothetical protein